MKRLFGVLAACCAMTAFAKPPRLTVFISVDSMSTDVLMRMKPRLKGGLSQLMASGAVYPNAHYDYAEAVTAAGHATLSTGSNPWRHGIVSNRIVNRQTGKLESILADASH